MIRARPGKALEESLGGRLAPALDSSAGLMLLASLPKSQLASIRLEPPSVPHVDDLSVAELVKRTQADGFATLQFADGAMSVSLPIGSPPVAALAVSARGLGRKDARPVATRLQATVDAITSELGAR